MTRTVHRWLGLVCLLSAALITQTARADCAHWDPVSRHSRYGDRPITARDLIELANFGRPDAEPVGGPSPLGPSPDGRLVATIIDRADLETNGFCQALVVVDLSGATPPRVLDRGGDFLMNIYAAYGHFTPNGFSRLNAARFSPDGHAIAYLKRIDGRIQVWRAPLDGLPATMLTHAPDDVTGWAWSDDGHSLVFSYDKGRRQMEAALDAEGRTGWHYDSRMVPMSGTRPLIRAPLAQADALIDPDTQATTAASPKDIARLALGGDDPLTRHRTAAYGTTWAERTGSTSFSGSRIRMLGRDGTPVACAIPVCVGAIKGLWWIDGGRQLAFLRLEGWNDRYTALYRWAPGRGQPRRVLQTDDVIEGCVPARRALICTRQGAEQPPRLVAVDPLTGATHVLFDPNPGFYTLPLGKVERLQWQTASGSPVYGDLVLPHHYNRGRLPVIVTLYRSRGLLRGGTGNDYPIQLFQQRGFAVLSIDRPALFAQHDASIQTDDAFWRANLKEWADRRNVDSAIQSGIDLLIAKGIADPARLGLTGLSDGASSVRFAIIHSTRFAAAALSTCCVDELANDITGPGWEKQNLAMGYPPAAPLDTQFWRPYSLALSAERVTTPLLMQLADSELLTGVHAFTALKATKAPVDLYVFPDEYHIKWQPVHRAAIYTRDLDWFSFWLQNNEDPAPAKTGQYVLWQTLRAERDAKRKRLRP